MRRTHRPFDTIDLEPQGTTKYRTDYEMETTTLNNNYDISVLERKYNAHICINFFNK